MEKKQELIVDALKQLFPHITSILLKNDSTIRQQEGLELYTRAAFGTPPEYVELQENGVAFIAPLQEGQKTGWFYDHRLNRARLKAYVSGCRVLDVFSYLGAFGIQAAVFQAASVTCIESSKMACEYIEKNARHNHVEDKITVIQEEAFSALKAMVQASQHFDVIILDPPVFIKKQKDKNAGTLAYQRLFALALQLLAPNGLLFACSCSMHLSYETLVDQLQRASQKVQKPLQILERGHQASDHPVHPAIAETDYLKMVVVRSVGGIQ